ncbi:MAG: ABC transporter permease subunit [Bacillota bacterium]
MSKQSATAPQTTVSLPKKEGVLKRMWKQKDLQMMALPGVIWMFIFNYIPMYFIVIAFQRYSVAKGISGSEWIGFTNFIEFFQDDRFGLVIWNTIGLNLLRLVVCFPAGIIFALLVNELSSVKFKKFIQTVSYLPHFLSWVIVSGIMFNWMSETGILTELLVKVGILSEPRHMFGTTDGFWTILVSAELWKELGWSAIIYIAAISGIDESLYEAASIDGAGRFRKIWSITLPSIQGTIAVLLVLNISNLLGSNFDQLYVFMKPTLYDAIDVIDIYAYRMGISSGRMSYATAIGLMRSIVAFILLYIANAGSKKLTGTTLY